MAFHAAPAPDSSPPPTYTTSLLTAQHCAGHVHLILGANPLAAARASSSLAAGAKPILIAPLPPSPSSSAPAPLHYSLASLIESGALTHLARPFAKADLFTLGRPEVGGVVDAVFVTAPPASLPLSLSLSFDGRDARDARDVRDGVAALSALCRRHRIPINVVDAPALCSFSLLSVHADGPLQVGVTTNGQGCKLAGRIRREIAAALPAGLGAACARLGEVRRRVILEEKEGRAVKGVKEEEEEEEEEEEDGGGGGEEAEGNGRTPAACVRSKGPPPTTDEGVDDSVEQSAGLNRLVREGDAEAARTRRMRWLAQVCEYWPLKRLAAITDDDVEAVLRSYPGASAGSAGSAGPADAEQQQQQQQQQQNRTNPNPKPRCASPPLGRVILAGSGPGHPDLLTRATYKAIQAADVVLADKLVPAGVLDLIPRRTPVTIARKFPGNAERAQEELLEQALEGVRAGRTVLRLKQGDPFVYGRGGEEVAFFRSRGLGDRVLVLPGLTSSLCAPLFAGIPPTQRDVADQVLVCTGTGKQGRAPRPPEYVASRTVVFLMALHRIEGLVAELTGYTEEEEEEEEEYEEELEEQGEGGEEEQEDAHQREKKRVNETSQHETSTDTQQQNERGSSTSTGRRSSGSSSNSSSTTPRPRPRPRMRRRRRTLWPATTPCAVVERASCPDQRVIRTTLRFVAEAVEQEGSRPPGLLVVGRACEALHAPEKGRSWVVEDGFKGLDLLDFGGADFGGRAGALGVAGMA